MLRLYRAGVKFLDVHMEVGNTSNEIEHTFEKNAASTILNKCTFSERNSLNT